MVCGRTTGCQDAHTPETATIVNTCTYFGPGGRKSVGAAAGFLAFGVVERSIQVIPPVKSLLGVLHAAGRHQPHDLGPAVEVDDGLVDDRVVEPGELPQDHPQPFGIGGEHGAGLLEEIERVIITPAFLSETTAIGSSLDGIP